MQGAVQACYSQQLVRQFLYVNFAYAHFYVRNAIHKTILRMLERTGAVADRLTCIKQLKTMHALYEQKNHISTSGTIWTPVNRRTSDQFPTYRTFRSYLKESYTDIVDVARQTQRDVDLPVRLQKIPQYCDIAAATL